MITIRKPAAVDMLWLGQPVILTEYALGIALPLLLGLFSLRSWLFGSGQFGLEVILGLWHLGIAANYIPLLLYALAIARGGTVKKEGQPELARAKRYGIQEAIILVPLLVVVLTLQETQHLRKG